MSKVLGYIRHEVGIDQKTFYIGERQHEYDYEVLPSTTLEIFLILLGANAEALLAFERTLRDLEKTNG